MATQGVTAETLSCSDTSTTASSRRMRSARQMAARSRREALLQAAYSRIELLEMRVEVLTATLNEVSSFAEGPRCAPVASTGTQLFDISDMGEFHDDCSSQTDVSFAEHSWPCQSAVGADGAVALGLAQLAHDRLRAHWDCSARVADLCCATPDEQDVSAPFSGGCTAEYALEPSAFDHNEFEEYIGAALANLRLFEEAAAEEDRLLDKLPSSASTITASPAPDESIRLASPTFESVEEPISPVKERADISETNAISWLNGEQNRLMQQIVALLHQGDVGAGSARPKQTLAQLLLLGTSPRGPFSNEEQFMHALVFKLRSCLLFPDDSDRTKRFREKSCRSGALQRLLLASHG